MSFDPNAWHGSCYLTENGRPVIRVGSETVPEARRLQAALNMRLVHDIKARVVALLGEPEARKRYPEAFMSDEELCAIHPQLYTDGDGDAE